jgi:hypothetical protein
MVSVMMEKRDGPSKGRKSSEVRIEEVETLSHCRGWQHRFIGWFVLKSNKNIL